MSGNMLAVGQIFNNVVKKKAGRDAELSSFIEEEL